MEMAGFIGFLYLVWCVVFAPVLLLAGIKDRMVMGRPFGRFVLAMVASVAPLPLVIQWTLHVQQ